MVFSRDASPLTWCLEVAKARLFGGQYDLPFRGLPSELRNKICRHSFMRIAKDPNPNSNSDQYVPYPFRRTRYWQDLCISTGRYQTLSIECILGDPNCIHKDLTILKSGNIQLTLEAGSYIYFGRTFYFSPENDKIEAFHLPKKNKTVTVQSETETVTVHSETETVPVHPRVQHIKVDLPHSSVLPAQKFKSFFEPLRQSSSSILYKFQPS